MVGTNYFTKYTSTVDVALTDQFGLAALIRCNAASLPTDAGYAIGCIAYAKDTGALYTNTGTASVASFTAVTTGSALTVPTALSDTTTTTGASLADTASSVTTGIINKMIGAAATMTTGRYYSANDGATEVFGIGANGHVHSKVSAVPPSIAVSTQAGITAAALATGASDTCGSITTTGTSTGGTIITVTFGKTYTTAPKSITLTAANAAGGGVNTPPYVSTISATTFAITIPASGTYAATPSWYYQVIA